MCSANGEEAGQTWQPSSPMEACLPWAGEGTLASGSIPLYQASHSGWASGYNACVGCQASMGMRRRQTGVWQSRAFFWLACIAPA